jgi:putative ABC transport system permease protein
MIRSYFRLALRNLWKNKVSSLINIAGLSMGIAICILIMLFVGFERSFDEMHKPNVYRLDEVQFFPGMAAPQNVALSMYPMAPTLKTEYPEIKDYTRISQFEMAALAYKEKHVFYDMVLWADEGFFRVLGFKLLRGDPAKALSQPNSVVLTKEGAKKLFGEEDPIGKSVESFNMRDTIHFTITGVMEDVPANSHLQFQGLYSMSTIVNPKQNWREQWGGNWVITYLELEDKTNIASLEKKFPAFLKKYLPNDLENRGYKLFLQSIKNVHGTSQEITHDYLNFQKFSEDVTRTFMLIGIIVLVIACVNFVNLSTAHASGRAREVGVRKCIGGKRSQLIFQFMGESLLLTFISLSIAVVLVSLALPFVNRLSEHELHFDVLSFSWSLRLLALTLFVGVLAGFYPALYLSSFRPVTVLKGIYAGAGKRSLPRSILVTIQFACAAFLIIATIFVLRQLDFMRSKDPGFKTDQVVMLPGAYRGYGRLYAKLHESTLVRSVTGTSQRMGNNFHQRGFFFRGEGPEKECVVSNVVVDHEFISLYQIKMLAGKEFTPEGVGKECIVNESLAKELLKDHPGASYQTLLGRQFTADPQDSSTVIVGVTSDFNFNSLHNKVETLYMLNDNRRGFHDVSVKVDGTRMKEALVFLEKSYGDVITTFPYSYQFLDDHFNQLYKADEKVSKVISILGGLAIFIACLGLLGLASFSVERRVKEIGVRKVLGASVASVVSLLSGEFIRLVIIANLIAWPLAWYAVIGWLQNYAYHIEISWWVFALAGLLSLFIALLSVGSQTLKAAMSNPVKSLRTE